MAMNAGDYSSCHVAAAHGVRFDPALTIEPSPGLSADDFLLAFPRGQLERLHDAQFPNGRRTSACFPLGRKEH